mmetsp:Transcript_30412/g.69166  ORF Transcript_30412/g.69166 Transcript_30412/m.69166 type:complete len:410 (+) Transcript_30412:16-1245(+)
MSGSVKLRWQQHNFYSVLGVTEACTSADVKKAFRTLALKQHPDKVPPSQRARATERFQLIAEAYEVLSDGGLRSKYDAMRRAPQPRSAGRFQQSRPAAPARPQPPRERTRGGYVPPSEPTAFEKMFPPPAGYVRAPVRGGPCSSKSVVESVARSVKAEIEEKQRREEKDRQERYRKDWEAEQEAKESAARFFRDMGEEEVGSFGKEQEKLYEAWFADRLASKWLNSDWEQQLSEEHQQVMKDVVRDHLMRKFSNVSDELDSTPVADNSPTPKRKAEPERAGRTTSGRPVQRTESKATGAVLQYGDEAEIRGLESEAGRALNGKRCTVMDYDEGLKRHVVLVKGIGEKKIRPENLVEVDWFVEPGAGDAGSEGLDLVDCLVAMGYSKADATRAKLRCSTVESAIDWLRTN